jgi:GrpB-like predicted nucleotidyltransferase (UPF0157 family)
MPIFEPASKPPAEYHDWDPRYPDVVRTLTDAIGQLPEGVTFEHVGSTAVVGCGGKGVIDLLALYPEDALEPAKRHLLELGLNRQGPEFSRPWPESRPMFLGWYRYLGEPFLIYVHVVCRSSDEVRRFREFKHVLGSSAELVVEYCQLKRLILASGITDTDDYAVRKRSFFRRALGVAHALVDIDAK